MLTWIPPSPTIAITLWPGAAMVAPIEAGTANPIAPIPPEISILCFSLRLKELAAHI